ncbi:FG-GAP-like repeat-containing protein [Streptomyces olivoreticuli]
MPETPRATSRTARKSAATAALTLAGLALSLVSAAPATAASLSTWDKVAQCESSGNWQINTGNGFYGGVQIYLPTWNAYGGREYATYPHQATKQQQILIAEKILAGQGAGAWGSCGAGAGLGGDHADPYPITPPAPVGMVHLTAADFTGDGRKDLVGVESATGKLWLYPGKGDGTFGDRVQIGSGWNAMSKLAAADYTDDGKADLLAVDSATGGLYVYAGTGTANGMNTLGARTRIGTGWSSMRELTAIDVNSDGRADLLAIDTDGALWAYPGSGSLAGDNTLGNRVRIGTGWDTMTELTSPGDLNADGKADLVAVDRSGALWAYPGTGSLKASDTLGARTRIGTGWDTMRQLVGADFDNDGKGDLEAVQAPAGSTGTLYFYPGTGNTALGSRTQTGTGW